MPHLKKVLLLLGNVGFHREVILGIAARARAHGQWYARIWIPPDELDRILDLEQPDGVIIHASEGHFDALKWWGGPAVNISARLPPPEDFASVVMDNQAIGRKAAEHFLERGLRRFGFVRRDMHFSSERLRGYSARLKMEGWHVEELITQGTLTPSQIAHLRAMPKPVGIFAADDRMALDVNRICIEQNLRVPDDVAILGCDNDEEICALGRPPLSSIDVSGRQIGFAAAQLLHDMMAGKPAPPEPVLVPPKGVVSRHSTAVLAVEDEHVARVVKYIRDHVTEPLQVGDLLRQVPISRRVFERRFRDAMGHSPLEAISRARVERVRELLIQTGLSMDQVAEGSGFRSAQRMAAMFRRATGLTPTAYRRQFQLT